MPRILAISNQKGGVGKTTTAINLASALSLLNQSVLLIDIDPQGNASSGMGLPKTKTHSGIADVLLNYIPLSEAIRPVLPSYLPGLHLAPATSELIGLTRELMYLKKPDFCLKNAIQNLEHDYDYILIDCPPALNMLTLNALTAADGVLIPMQPEFFAVEGIGDQLKTIHHIRRKLNPRLTLSGVIITMVNKSLRLSREIIEQIQDHFGEDYVFATMPPRNIHLSEATSHGQPIHVYAPHSQGAKAYTAIARELLFRDGIIDSPEETPSLSHGTVDPQTGLLTPKKHTIVSDNHSDKRATSLTPDSI